MKILSVWWWSNRITCYHLSNSIIIKSDTVCSLLRYYSPFLTTSFTPFITQLFSWFTTTLFFIIILSIKHTLFLDLTFNIIINRINTITVISYWFGISTRYHGLPWRHTENYMGCSDTLWNSSLIVIKHY